jgi:hypothetical protein
VVRRSAVMLALSGTMFVAAGVVLRPPDVSDGVSFFVGGIPTMAAGEAVLALVAWLAIVLAVFATVLEALRDIRASTPHLKTAPGVSLVLAVGLLLFAFGAVERALPMASICCGSGSANIREATELAR